MRLCVCLRSAHTVVALVKKQYNWTANSDIVSAYLLLEVRAG